MRLIEVLEDSEAQENKMKLITNKQSLACPLIEEVTEDDVELANQLVDLAKSYTDPEAVGLALNQYQNLETKMPYGRRICVVRRNRTNEWIKAFNPAILEISGKRGETRETCFSWPNQRIYAERSASVLVEWLDESGDRKVESFEGLTAIAWQHEIDHLDGNPFRFEPRTFETKTKIGRNESCPCGSGRKYKKCCERAE